MTLSKDRRLWRLVECPVCGLDMSDYSFFQIDAHIGAHSPVDFGLSPIGERKQHAVVISEP